MPTFYGEDSQVMHAHDIIHLADDVQYFKVPLTELSAFWGENFIGKFKNLVTGHKKSLAQIVNRLTAMSRREDQKVKKKEILSNCILLEPLEVSLRKGTRMINIQSITYKDLIIEIKEPNNLVHLHDDKFFLIKKMYIKEEIDIKSVKPEDILIEGYCDSGRENVFDTPCPSSEIGIVALKEFNAHLDYFTSNNIYEKYNLLKVYENYFSISFLHC